MLAEAIEVQRIQNLQHATDLLAQVCDMEKLAMSMMNAALVRNDEAAAAGWYDRVLKASVFRLSVENTWTPKRLPKNPIVMKLAKQEKLAEMAVRFASILDTQEEAIEGRVIDEVVQCEDESPERDN